MSKDAKDPKEANPTKKPAGDQDPWLAVAATVEKTDNPLNIPYDIALEEAVAAARFVRERWEPEGTRPGLCRAKKRLPLSTADDTLALVASVQAAQTRLILLVDPVVANHGERARFLIDELESVIEFVLDDGVEEPADQQLLQVQTRHSQNGQRSSALAQALHAYAVLAEQLQARIVEVDEDFDVALIAEAKQLAAVMATSPTPAAAGSPEARAAIKLRNQLLHLLTGKVRLIRKTAAHVFRQHPELLREVSSAYERRRRAAARRAKKTTPPEGKPE